MKQTSLKKHTQGENQEIRAEQIIDGVVPEARRHAADESFKKEENSLSEVDLLYGKLTDEIQSSGKKSSLEAIRSYLIMNHHLYGLSTLDEKRDAQTSVFSFFKSGSIVHRCINEQHLVEIHYPSLKLTEEQRLNLQRILQGRDGLEAFEFIPGSTQEKCGCITQLAFESAPSAKNLIIALKQALGEYQTVSFSFEEGFSKMPWLEAIIYKEKAGEHMVTIDYPKLRLTQVERTRLQTILQTIERNNSNCEPEKTVLLKNCIQQLVFISPKNAQACLAELHATIESGLEKNVIRQQVPPP